MLTLMLGFSTGVGKTAINIRFIHQSFSSQWNHTIGVDFRIKMLELGGLRLKLQGWPSAYLSLARFCLRWSCAHKRSAVFGWCMQCGTLRGMPATAPAPRARRTTEGRTGFWWSTTSPPTNRGKASSAGSILYAAHCQIMSR
jgi:hypothetical protein